MGLMPTLWRPRISMTSNQEAEEPETNTGELQAKAKH